MSQKGVVRRKLKARWRRIQWLRHLGGLGSRNDVVRVVHFGLPQAGFGGLRFMRTEKMLKKHAKTP